MPETDRERQPVTSSDNAEAFEHALARSVVYRVVARTFQRPSSAVLAELTAKRTAQVLRDATTLLDAGRSQVPPVLPAVRQLADPSEGFRLADLVTDYDRLFGHTARGTVCPYETEYGATAPFQQPQTLADIAGSYRAFGLRRSSALNERVDHIGCECDFLTFLALKEAYVMERLADEQEAERDVCADTLEETRKASRLFLRNHLGRFGRAFASTVMKENPDRFYGCAASVLYRMLDLDCERLEVRVGPLTLELRSDAEDETPMGCGDGQQLIQIQTSRP